MNVHKQDMVACKHLLHGCSCCHSALRDAAKCILRGMRVVEDSHTYAVCAGAAGRHCIIHALKALNLRRLILGAGAVWGLEFGRKSAYGGGSVAEAHYGNRV